MKTALLLLCFVSGASGSPSLARRLPTTPSLIAVHSGAVDALAPPPPPPPPPKRRRLQLPVLTPSAQIVVNLILWWALNVVFNLSNKQCLNHWPHPWALSVSHLAVGTLCMLPLYVPLPRAAERKGAPREWVPTRYWPRLGNAECATLLPVVGLLSVGHVTSTLAPAYGTVAFSNIVKTAEPLFTCACSMALYRRTYSWPVYVALLMVVAGVALVSCRDVNFSSFSLAAGMISNAAFALYSISAKRALQLHPAALSPRAAYALLTMGSCAALAPVALLMELTGAGASRLASASAKLATPLVGWRLVALLAFTGVVQYVSNEIAFCTRARRVAKVAQADTAHPRAARRRAPPPRRRRAAISPRSVPIAGVVGRRRLSMIHPVTYAVANTLKRSIVVASSLLFFRQSLPPLGYMGAVMAIAGAFLYSMFSVR